MIGQTVFTMLIWALVTDCLDYSEWKFHERSDGSMYSIYTFSRKIGSTIASSGISFALSAIGYVAGTNVTQSAATSRRYLQSGNIDPGCNLCSRTDRYRTDLQPEP